MLQATLTLRQVFVVMLLVLTSSHASAQTATTYPTKPVKLIVGFAPGGGNDILARIFSERLSELLGQAFVVENRAGAAGRLSADLVSRAPADGYTLLIAPSGTMSIAAAVYDDLSYHPTKTFAPISPMALFPSLVLVIAKDHPSNSLAELIAWAKANPDKSNYGTSSPSYTIVTELLKLRGGMPAQQIPFRSSNESLVSVLGGHTLFTIADSPTVLPMIKGGQLKAIAVTGTQRLKELPDVPSMAELGFPDVEISLWSGVFAPAGTPADIVAKLQTAIKEASNGANVQSTFKTLELEKMTLAPAEFASTIDREIVKYREIVKAANLKIKQ